MQTELNLRFADGEYQFALPTTQIRALEEAAGEGIGAIYARVMKGRGYIEGMHVGNPLEAGYRLTDLTNTIRLALIGGGRGVVDGEEVQITPAKANALIEAYVTAAGQPIREAWTLTAAILAARIEGYDPPAVEASGDETVSEDEEGDGE